MNRTDAMETLETYLDNAKIKHSYGALGAMRHVIIEANGKQERIAFAETNMYFKDGLSDHTIPYSAIQWINYDTYYTEGLVLKMEIFTYSGIVISLSFQNMEA